MKKPTLILNEIQYRGRGVHHDLVVKYTPQSGVKEAIEESDGVDFKLLDQLLEKVGVNDSKILFYYQSDEELEEFLADMGMKLLSIKAVGETE